MAREALAFDMYGTLVDPIRIWKLLEQYIPHNGMRVAELWRQKQLEYTFRLTVMERYEDFEQVTRKALDYALAASGSTLTTEQKHHLMAQYNDLERFPDVEPGLERLQLTGHTSRLDRSLRRSVRHARLASRDGGEDTDRVGG